MTIKKILLTLIGSLISIFFLVVIIGYFFTESYINEKINSLRATIKTEKKIFSYNEIEDLPFLLQRYYKNTITEGAVKPQFVRLKQTTEFKFQENSAWRKFTSEQYYSINKPGYVLTSSEIASSLLSEKTIESYVETKGEKLVKFLSSITTEDADGVEMNNSGLFKYFSDAVFFPSALLPSVNVKWIQVAPLIARGTFWDKNIRIGADFHFDEDGNILKITSEDKYRITKQGFQRSHFTIVFSDYKEFDGLKIPTSAEATWNLPGRDFLFSKYTINDLSYDIPFKY
ncbi:MAG: hypothetical protein KJ799_02480 [Bacteroidetes bacterium]|nr:hypothetical protein [Bacteroidota bacterium]MBU1677373.1 hypothetical protein [Bacteroidota bacterium]MBU2505578.1 hypothetical protein [Bacteroidota bacterium]